MSVRMKRTIVMRMQTAVTQRGVSHAPATQATLEMGSTVQVSLQHRITSINNKQFIYYPAQTLILQILTSVNWRHIHAIPMPTALTQMAASTALVGKALKAMGSTVQV